MKWLDCTGDVCSGDIIRFSETVFGEYNRHRISERLGERTITAQVLKESYGQKSQQHTFTLQVVDCVGECPIEMGKVIRRKGRNIYRNGTWRKEWDCEVARSLTLKEKHVRGAAARRRRDERKMKMNSKPKFDSFFEGDSTW